MVTNNESELWSVEKVGYHERRDLWDENGNYTSIRMNDLAENQIGVKIKEEQDDGSTKIAKYIITITDHSQVESGRNPLLESMKGLNSQSLGFAHKYLNTANSFLRGAYTTYNPSFIFTNFERDIQTAIAHLGIDYTMEDAWSIVDVIPQAMEGILTNLGRFEMDNQEWSDVYEDYKANGGKMGWIETKDIDQRVKDFQKKIKSFKGQNKVSRYNQEIVSFISDMNEMVENAVRVSTYKHLMDNGVDKAKAIQISKNLTVNFNQKGELGSLINTLY